MSNLYKTQDEAIAAGKLAIESGVTADLEPKDPRSGHIGRRDCWCEPEVIPHEGRFIVVHRSRQ